MSAEGGPSDDWAAMVVRNRDLLARAAEARTRAQEAIAQAEDTVRLMMENVADRESTSFNYGDGSLHHWHLETNH
jgi:hypothetical protein